MEITNSMVVRRYKAGYEIRDEYWTMEGCGDRPTHMRQAYTPSGGYIGDSKIAYRLCDKRGIRPELARQNDNICSIGFCEREKRWYGWSHRAIYGFGMGSTCEPGNCHYLPSNKEEFIESMRRWYSNDMYKNLLIDAEEDGVRIKYEIHQKKTGNIMEANDFEPYPETWGKGSWTAQTLDDAKQMAIDFADSVS
jgi:hypothetical protein